MDENTKEKLEKAKEVSGNFLGKVWNVIKNMRAIFCDLEDSGGKIIAISKFCVHLSFYLTLILEVVWVFAGFSICRVYHWTGYGSGYYSLNIGYYLLGFVVIALSYIPQYLAALWMKSHGELVNNTKVVADSCKLKEMEEMSSQILEETLESMEDVY